MDGCAALPARVRKELVDGQGTGQDAAAGGHARSPPGQLAADYEAQLRQRGEATESNPAMTLLREIREQAVRAATSGQRMSVAVRLDKWERQFLPPLLSAEDITKVVTAHEPAIAECVKKQREQQPGLSGKLEMRWAVQPNGSAKEVSCLSRELCSTYLAGCLTGLIQGWSFPARASGAKTVEYPFAF